METGTAHSAADGFRDIKPPPAFHPAPLWWYIAPAVLLAACAVWWWMKRERKPVSAVTESARERARREIGALRSERAAHTVAVRDFASRLSLSLRGFLESELSFAAAEQTVSEVTRELPHALRRRFPALGDEAAGALCNRFKSLLRFLERVAFADDSAEQFPLDGEPIANALHTAEELVSAIEQHLDALRAVPPSRPGAP